MGLQRLLANAAMTAAHATKRLSHGVLFLSGGLMTLADHRRSAAGAHENSPQSTADALSGLNRVEEQAYQHVVPPGARLCVIGCGTGRDVLPFVARGHQVVAVEPEAGAVATLLRLLDERGFSAQVICGYGEEAALPGLFDSVILSPHCYGNMPGAARRIAFLARLRSQLAPGGRIAINFLPRSGPLNSAGLRIAAAIRTPVRLQLSRRGMKLIARHPPGARCWRSLDNSATRRCEPGM